VFDAEGVEALADLLTGGLSAPAQEDLVPVLPALRPLVPGGGLQPGSVVCVEGPGAGSLGLGLIAGAAQDSRPGAGWCAAVGLPEFGVLAAAGMGADLARLLLVDEPGDRWPDVVAALTEAVDLILVRPGLPPAPAIARRLTATARKHGCALAVAGPWDGARLRLQVAESSWIGLGAGHGHLQGRKARVVAAGRGSAGHGRDTWIWLPAPDGTITPVETPAETPARPHLEVVA
jgi:hypothetical protein